jgi:hypothetical protein
MDTAPVTFKLEPAPVMLDISVPTAITEPAHSRIKINNASFWNAMVKVSVIAHGAGAFVLVIWKEPSPDLSPTLNLLETHLRVWSAYHH